MSFFQKLRNRVFWFLDSIKGGTIANDISEISDYNIMFGTDFNSKNAKLIEILKHASESTKFYKNIPEPELNLYPVITKSIIRERFEDFVSNSIPREEMIKVITSGSTGTPFWVFHDVGKRKRNTADTIYFSKLAGFEIGQQLVYFKVWNSINKKNRFVLWAQNIRPQDVTSMSDLKVKNFVKWLSNNSEIKGFLGYASALETLCNYLDRFMPDIRIKHVSSAICISEAMNKYTYDSIWKYFSVRAVSRYSNVENGIIAQQIPGEGSGFIVNWSSYFVEILNMDNDSPAPLGSEGRIVVTDYYNFAMPLIRYDTGDIGVMNWDRELERHVLSRIEGRMMDLVYDTSGNLISSFTVTNNMWKYPEITQYQFIQKSKDEYEFIINCQDEFAREGEMREEFTNYFGASARFSFKYVDEVPVLNSGKRRKVRNDWMYKDG